MANSERQLLITFAPVLRLMLIERIVQTRVEVGTEKA